VHRAPMLMRPIFGTELREHLSQALDEAFRRPPCGVEDGIIGDVYVVEAGEVPAHGRV